MKKQIKDLELWEVDYLVAKAEGLEAKLKDNRCLVKDNISFYSYSPTTNPSQAWPIIERDKINIGPINDGLWSAEKWINNNNFVFEEGKTSLEAAMRCYLSSVYGNEVEL